MKKLVLLLAFASIVIFSQEKTTISYHIVDKNGNDSIEFRTVKVADTTFYYSGDSLTFKRIENDSISYSYRGGKLVWWTEKKVEKMLIKDNRCNGIKLDGQRCSRTVDNSKNVYFCWQHKN